MKLRTGISIALATLLTPAVHAQASGPNTPPVGSTVPDGLTFTLSTTPLFGEPGLAGQRSLGQVEVRSYNDFEGQILLVAYHASW